MHHRADPGHGHAMGHPAANSHHAAHVHPLPGMSHPMMDPDFNPAVMVSMRQRMADVVACLQIEKVQDLPFPKDPTLNRVDVCVHLEEQGALRELKRLGPFPCEQQGSPSKKP